MYGQLRVLLVSGEYPPMTGGVGRYSENLVNALNRTDKVQVFVVARNTCNSKSDKVFCVLEPGSRKNSDLILNLIDETRADIVHVQYERGLYEVDNTVHHQLSRAIHGSTLDKMYHSSPVPTITTLHTLFPWAEYRQYLREHIQRNEGRFRFLPPKLRRIARTIVLKRRFKLLLDILGRSDELVHLSRVSYELAGKGHVIYHGAEPALEVTNVDKSKLKQELGLPANKKLLLAFGYVGSYKGFDVLERIKMPSNWALVVKQNIHERGTESAAQIPSAINLPLNRVDNQTLSKIFLACEAVILPYRIVSTSGVLFDALAHGLPFIASNLRFFKEFADLGMGIVCNREPESFEKALLKLEQNYDWLQNNVIKFKNNFDWNGIAQQHVRIYEQCRLSGQSVDSERVIPALKPPELSPIEKTIKPA